MTHAEKWLGHTIRFVEQLARIVLKEARVGWLSMVQLFEASGSKPQTMIWEILLNPIDGPSLLYKRLGGVPKGLGMVAFCVCVLGVWLGLGQYLLSQGLAAGPLTLLVSGLLAGCPGLALLIEAALFKREPLNADLFFAGCFIALPAGLGLGVGALAGVLGLGIGVLVCASLGLSSAVLVSYGVIRALWRLEGPRAVVCSHLVVVLSVSLGHIVLWFSGIL